MEKKIIFTPTEPSTNLLWLHYKEDSLVLESFGSNGWEPVGGFDEKELAELLSRKADLIGGKIPESQLPSYLDDVIDYFSMSVSGIDDIPGKTNLANRTYWVYEAGSEYSFKFINTNANKTKDDWTVSDPERGKIYLNLTNNHSYRWTGDVLWDLDKDFSDRLTTIEVSNLFVNLGIIADINDLSKNNASVPVIKSIYTDVLNSTNASARRNAATLFNYNSKQYCYPIFDRDPVNKTFKVYNHGNLQTYRSTLVNNVYGLEKVLDVPGYVILGDAGSGIDNTLAFTNFELSEIKQAVFVVGDRSIYGYVKRQGNVYHFAGFDGHSLRTYGITEAGVATLYNVTSINNLVSTDAYRSNGGNKNVGDFYKEMAAQFTINSVVINYSDLGKVVSDATLLARIKSASQLIINDVPNTNSPTIFIRGREASSIIDFINIAYGTSGIIRVSRIYLSLSTNAFSFLNSFDINDAYNIYAANGGDKIYSEFTKNLTAQFTANIITIDYSTLADALTDTDFINRVNKASTIILTNYTNNTDPLVFQRGFETENLIYFNCTYNSYSDAVIMYTFFFNKTSKKFSAITAISAHNLYRYYVSNGGTKSEVDFKAAFVKAIDAVS